MNKLIKKVSMKILKMVKMTAFRAPHLEKVLKTAVFRPVACNDIAEDWIREQCQQGGQSKGIAGSITIEKRVISGNPAQSNDICHPVLLATSGIVAKRQAEVKNNVKASLINQKRLKPPDSESGLQCFKQYLIDVFRATPFTPNRTPCSYRVVLTQIYYESKLWIF